MTKHVGDTTDPMLHYLFSIAFRMVSRLRFIVTWNSSRLTADFRMLKKNFCVELILHFCFISLLRNLRNVKFNI